jgi:hypothetical protein
MPRPHIAAVGFQVGFLVLPSGSYHAQLIDCPSINIVGASY